LFLVNDFIDVYIIPVNGKMF